MSQGGFGSPEEYQENLRLRQQTQPQQATTPPTPLAVPQTAPLVATLTPSASGMAQPLWLPPVSGHYPFFQGPGTYPFQNPYGGFPPFPMGPYGGLPPHPDPGYFASPAQFPFPHPRVVTQT